MKLMLTAKEAARVTGYGSAARFRSAVERGVMPPAIDPDTRPMLWSRAQIEAVLTPATNEDQTDPRLAAFEKRVGMR